MLIFSRYSWWAGAMAGIAILLAGMTTLGLLSPVQGAVLSITSPLQKSVSGAFRPLATMLSDAGNLDAIRDENRRLRLENESLQVKVAELEQQTARVQELEQIANIPAATAATLKPANITGRYSSPFTDVVTIDRGTNAGIKVGMVVLSAQGSLFGTVTEVTSNASFVRLLTDSNSRVAAQVQDRGVLGSVEGAADRKLSFQFAETGDEIAVGDTIITSSIGGNYPAGIPIGTVATISGTAQDLFRKVEIQPTVRFSSAQTVLVNTSFTPLRSELTK